MAGNFPTARALWTGVLAFLVMGVVLIPGGRAASIPVSIASSSNPVDAGVAFELTAEVPFFNMVSGVTDQFLWTDSLGGTSSGRIWKLEVPTPGPVNVTLRVSGLSDVPSLANITVLVVAPPTVSLLAPYSQVDADVPAPYYVDVTGGVPPLQVNWEVANGGPNGSANWSSDGLYVEEVTFSAPGPGWVQARVVDALGDSSSTIDFLTEVVPEGSLEIATNETIAEVGSPLEAAVVVENGAPPFRWSLLSSLPLTVGPTPFGVFPADGLYRWNLTFAAAGTASLNLTLVDALGSVVAASTDLVVEPPLSINLTVPGELASSAFSVVANLSGGLAPYSYQIQLSNGAEWNGSRVTPGPIRANFDVTPGNYSVVIRVVDGLGRAQVASVDVRVEGSVPPESTSLEGTLPPVVAGIALGLGSAIVGLYAYRRWRRAPPSRSGSEPSALPAVRRLMEQSQVIDRETLLLLGEEAGESATSVEAALRTLIRLGEVSTESGPGTDEVLRWTGSGRSDPPPGALP